MRPSRRALGLAAAVLCLLATAARAADAPYLSGDDVVIGRYLAPPPAADTAAARLDLTRLLELQRGRSPSDVAEAQGDQEVSVFRFADVLGPAFNAAALPRTAALAQKVCRESSVLTAAAKRYWNRARPFVVSAEIEPVLREPADGSYPSGHATCGYLWAILLGEMLPEQREAIFRRGTRYGMNRAVGGVHYVSDVEAGRLAAVAIAAALLANGSFRDDFGTARAELRAAMLATAASRTPMSVEPAAAAGQ